MRSREPKTAGTLLLKQAAALFPEGEVRDQFVRCLVEGVGREPALMVLQDQPAITTFPRIWPTEWQPDFVVRIADHFRAAQHPLHAKGAFYCLDFSSVFSASAMLAIPEAPRYALDLCASPGGKAIFAWRAFRPEVLLCNETIRKRAGTLIANLERCQVSTSAVWSADPSVYGVKYPEAFDLVLVDAPCSGQSLLAKGDAAPGAFTPSTIDMCVGRQRRIMGHAARTVRPGGYLLYMTCTFSIKENEKVAAWLMEQYPEFEAQPVPALEAFRSTYSDFPSYRLFPQLGFGAGAFTCLLRHTGEPPEHRSQLEIAAHWRYGDVRTKPAPVKPDGEEEKGPAKPPKKAETVAPKRRSRTSNPFYDPKQKKPRRGRR